MVELKEQVGENEFFPLYFHDPCKSEIVSFKRDALRLQKQN